MEIRIAGTANDSIVDGPGLRFTLFVQGCPHRCTGCHNPQTHDFSGGEVTDTAVITEMINKNPLLDGVTFSGGEPFCQTAPLCEIALQVKKSGMDIVTYTGYTFEYLLENSDSENGFTDLLECTDILIDGRFELDKKTLDAEFRGSSNQRILDCQESLRQKKAVEYKMQ